jgi:hypothetical protein
MHARLASLVAAAPGRDLFKLTGIFAKARRCAHGGAAPDTLLKAAAVSQPMT